MDKVVHLGRGQFGNVFCHIQYKEGRLSITGVEGPMRNGDARGGCGQIVNTPIVEIGDDWTANKIKAFYRVWDRWHLNDVRAGCEHQRAAKWNERPIDPSKPTNAYGKHFEGQRQPSWNMLTWIPRSEHPEGLLSFPCEVCGYRYGTKWLKEEVPQKLLKWLASLPESKLTPAWV